MVKTNLKVWNVLLWFAQAMLAATFIWSGAMKIFKPYDLPWKWISDSPGLAVATGVLDLLAGWGLIVPVLLRIQPKLTIYAAYGIIIMMMGACAFHIERGEASQIGFNVFVAFCALFIAWGRQKKVPIEPGKV